VLQGFEFWGMYFLCIHFDVHLITSFHGNAIGLINVTFVRVYKYCWEFSLCWRKFLCVHETFYQTVARRCTLSLKQPKSDAETSPLPKTGWSTSVHIPSLAFMHRRKYHAIFTFMSFESYFWSIYKLLNWRMGVALQVTCRIKKQTIPVIF
jgi:hypothetical protein